MGIAARGLPRATYVDNGSPFVSGQLLRACALLGIRLIHSRPGRPEGRGKIERAFRTVREQFLVEVEHRPPGSVEELNRSFTAWVESVYHRARHSETGQPPLERFHVAGPAPTPPTEVVLREAFLWSEKRTVSKTGTSGCAGNDYEVDAELARQRVELVFDPLDLTELEVRVGVRTVGRAIPLTIRRHVHPKARAEPDLERPATGIDYLGLVAARRERELGRQQIDYRNLPPAGGENDEETSNRASSRLRAHWGFSKTPFTGELAPSMLFGSSSHQQAVARISWVVQERALGVVCGEVGAGKTVAARAATAGLDPSRHTVIYLPNPVIGARGIHAEIVRALGDTPRFHTAPLIAQAQEMLETEEAERGRRVVLVLDESHLLSSEQLEQLRMLTNSQIDLRARRSRACCSDSRHCADGFGKRRSPRWINGSRCATRSTGWTSRRPAITSRTI